MPKQDLSPGLTWMLEDLGYDVTYTRSETLPTDYSPATGSASASTFGNETVRGIFTEYRQDEIDGTHVQANDRKFTFRPVAGGYSENPQLGDYITGEGRRVEIVGFRTIKHHDTVVGYIAQCR